MMEKYKISAEEFAKTSFSRLATRPNSRSASGEGHMSAEELKKRFDRQGELFRAKFNAFLSLVSQVGEGESISSFIQTGIAQDHTLRAMFEDIVSDSGRFASYLSVGDATLIEKLADIKRSLDQAAAHEEKNNNPHYVTAEQLGLGKVDNTSDKDKPVSMAQSRALADKVDKLLPTGTAKVYGMAANGAQKGFDVTADKTGGSVALRDANGTFEVSDPTKGAHPVTRTFLETIVALLVGKEGNQTIGGDLSVDGDLYVTGRTYGTDMESLNVKDAVIVANADGVPLAGLSGYVIRAGGGKAYGILYDPVEDCVKIGLGTFDGEVFVYGANEAQVLATRDVIEHGNVPVWNGEKNTFEDSGKKADELATEQYIDELYGDIEGSLSAILAEQRSILAMQDALIGGGV